MEFIPINLSSAFQADLCLILTVSLQSAIPLSHPTISTKGVSLIAAMFPTQQLNAQVCRLMLLCVLRPESAFTGGTTPHFVVNRPLLFFSIMQGSHLGRAGVPFVQSSKLRTSCCRFIIINLEDYMKNHSSLLTASDCPSDKVYKPCGPVEQPTCDDK